MDESISQIRRNSIPVFLRAEGPKIRPKKPEPYRGTSAHFEPSTALSSTICCSAQTTIITLQFQRVGSIFARSVHLRHTGRNDTRPVIQAGYRNVRLSVQGSVSKGRNSGKCSRSTQNVSGQQTRKFFSRAAKQSR